MWMMRNTSSCGCSPVGGCPLSIDLGGLNYNWLDSFTARQIKGQK